jgi:hypothetical protein
LISELKTNLESGERVATKLKAAEADLKRLERKYRNKYNNYAFLAVTSHEPLLNAINATYGWCITVHKAVGSEFENIIFNVSQKENSGVNNSSYFRWLYSGITTACSKVYVSNPIEIGPFMDCHFEDTVEDGWTENTVEQNNKFEFEDFEIPQRFSSKISSELNQNIQAAISLFSEFVETKGILLERTQKSGDYASKAFYSLQTTSGELSMLFNNNGKGLVTSIRVERNGEAHNDLINKAIQFIRESSMNNDKYNNVEFPSDFRENVYKSLIEKSSDFGGELKLMACKSYHDIFIYSKGNNKIEFKLSYKAKGMFSYIKILRKTNCNISAGLHDLIFGNE